MPESEVKPINLAEGVTTPFFEIPIVGRFSRDEVEVTDTFKNFELDGELQQKVEEVWQARKKEVEAKGGHLEDRPKLVVSDISIKSGKLCLELGHGSYKYYVGLTDPGLRSQIGPEKLPKFLGTAALLETSDNYLVLDERSQTVFQYNGWLSVFAGSTELDDIGPDGVIDPFVTALRETKEETKVDDIKVEEMQCLGFMVDKYTDAGAVLFHIKTALTKNEIEDLQKNKKMEEGRSVFIPADPDEVRRKILEFSKVFVSDGASVLALAGKDKFGREWFENIVSRLNKRGKIYDSLTDKQRKTLEDRLILRLARNYI